MSEGMGTTVPAEPRPGRVRSGPGPALVPAPASVGLRGVVLSQHTTPYTGVMCWLSTTSCNGRAGRRVSIGPGPAGPAMPGAGSVGHRGGGGLAGGAGDRLEQAHPLPGADP